MALSIFQVGTILLGLVALLMWVINVLLLRRHLAGDLLREEQQREGSQYGELIKNYIKEGLIVPMEVTIVLLENAMREAIEKNKQTRFLIDGFPRKLDQAFKFEEVVSCTTLTRANCHFCN